MYISDSYLDALRHDGFAIVPDFLSPDEVRRARDSMHEIFPSEVDYFADPDRFRDLADGMFAGLRRAPFDQVALNQLAVHPSLVDFAERFLGSHEIEIYKIEAWMKYSGGFDYDQPHHYDFDNHSMVVPRRDGKWPQLTTFVFLTDVTEQHGPTMVVPKQHGLQVPLYPNPPVNAAELRSHEVPITCSAGSLFVYSTGLLHRGSQMTGNQVSRLALLADFQLRGCAWMGKTSWAGLADHPAWPATLARLTPRQRWLFGFPPPGHEFWNDQTLADVELRWPGIDLGEYWAVNQS